MTMFIKLPVHEGGLNCSDVIDLNKVLTFNKKSTKYVEFILGRDINRYASFNTEEERDEFYDKICNLIITEI